MKGCQNSRFVIPTKFQFHPTDEDDDDDDDDDDDGGNDDLFSFFKWASSC